MEKENLQEYLQNIIKNIPELPGCYQYFDEEGIIIYVGKAKNLKKRVSSYFANKHEKSPRTRILVSKIREIKYIVVDTESDTLLLENNLIKEFQPKYNVLLKDDKTYPSIVVRNEPFPRVEQTREIIRDGSLYFGPYTNVSAVKAMLELLHRLYPIRTCKLNLSEENIKAGKYKVCLEYHLKRCAGPCVGYQKEPEYLRNIEEVKEILNGNTGVVSKLAYQRMIDSSKNQEFEKAQEYKIKYDLIENFKSKSTIVSNLNYNIDVYNYDEDENSAYINYLHIANGAIIQAYTFEYKKRIEEEKRELLGLGIMEMRERYGSKAKEIVVPFIPDFTLENIKFTVPQRGDKQRLLKLSEQNVKQYKIDKLRRAESLNPEQRTTRILKEMKEALHLKELPFHIECFDNSNIQGTNPVSACVVFKNAKPSKADYRLFKVLTVEGPDDFATMREVVYRRYRRLLDEEESLPQLIVIDGGKGQLNAACDSLKELNLYGEIAIVGIAKRLEEIYYPEDPVPMYLDKGSDTLRVIQNLRDEAHRFGITFHRNRRSKGQIESELDRIKGLGQKSKETLLTRFKSVKRIKEASPELLELAIGKARAKLVKEHFENKDKKNKK